MAALLLFSSASLLPAGVPLDSAYAEGLYAGGLPQPTSLAFAPDGSGRLFVTLKETGVMVLGPEGKWRKLFARFPELYTEAECGVLGVTFDPDYLTNKFVYVFVTVSSSEQRIYRFQDYGSSGVGRVPIIRGLPSIGRSHNGGAIGFGPDGRLYWAVGDNGIKRGVDGDLHLLNAKVGRATRGGKVPADNPFVDSQGPRNDFVWASGFRNPFKMTFQPRTGLLWLDVVGSSPEGQTMPVSGPGYEQIFALQAGEDGGYDDFEANQPSAPRFTLPKTRPLAKPKIEYRTDYMLAGDAARRKVTGVSKDGELYTFTTTEAVPFHAGELVTYNPVGNDSAHTLVVANVLAKGFVARGSNREITGLTGSVAPLGGEGCVVGGTFYESSFFPATEQGSFFFGDYNSGNIYQVHLNAENKPAAPRRFAMGGQNLTDMTVGPDGALYYASYGSSSIRRVGYVQAKEEAQHLAVTPTTLRMLEGVPACFNVRLTREPASPINLQVKQTGGKAAISVTEGATLSFDQNNWRKPQRVVLQAGTDVDLVDDEATLEISQVPIVSEEAPASPAETVPAQTVRVFVKDLGQETPVLSTSSLRLAEGQVGSFTVVLAAAPVRTITLMAKRTGGSHSAKVISGEHLTFTAENWNIPQTVQVKAAHDRNAQENTAKITVSGNGYWGQQVQVTLTEGATTE